MNNPTFSETVARFKELGGRIVINGDVATTIDHIRTFFKKHGYAIEGDTEVEPTEPMLGSLVYEVDAPDGTAANQEGGEPAKTDEPPPKTPAPRPPRPSRAKPKE